MNDRAMTPLQQKMTPKLIEVMEPLDMRTVWEHTPLDYYRYGEYPRFLRPVGAHQPRTKTVWVKEQL